MASHMRCGGITRKNVGVPVYLEGGSVDSRDSTEELDPMVTDSLIDPDAHDAPPRFPEVWDLHRGGLRLLYAPPILLLLSQRLIIHPVFKLINNVQSGVGKGELRVAMFFCRHRHKHKHKHYNFCQRNCRTIWMYTLHPFLLLSLSFYHRNVALAHKCCCYHDATSYQYTDALPVCQNTPSHPTHF